MAILLRPLQLNITCKEGGRPALDNTFQTLSVPFNVAHSYQLFRLLLGKSVISCRARLQCS